MVGGLVFGNIGGAIAGGTFGFKAMLKSIAPQTVMYIATVILLGWNPVVLVTILASTLIQGVINATGMTKKIRDAAGKEYAERFRAARSGLANAITVAVDKKLEDLQNALDQGFGLEIQNIRDQVDSVIADKQQGQAKVSKSIRRLEAIPDELDAIDSEIDALTSSLLLL
jgi:peptidoglycan hydrolase CwlO-like protein